MPDFWSILRRNPEWAAGQGFSWRGGFLHDYSSRDKIAIILLDTQGTFDSRSTVRDCATVFALSTMLSSVQIYNLSQNINEDDLQHLQLFTEYGRLALANTGKKPFQRLQFLVRDWSFPYEAEYGALGGDGILKNRLQVSEKQHPELQSVRRHISSCFTEVDCFLMPHPGLIVATDPQFKGKLMDISSEFKNSLQTLVPMLLAPENLIYKEINGQRVRARDLIQYFRSYVNIYKGNELPEPRSILAATAEANHLIAVAVAKELYHQLMEEVCGETHTYVSTDDLEKKHIQAKDAAIFQFATKPKMGCEELTEMFRQQLEHDLEKLFVNFRKQNEGKTFFKRFLNIMKYFGFRLLVFLKIK